MSNDVLTESRENGTHNRSPLTWLVAAAAAVIIAGVGIFAVVNGRGRRADPAAAGGRPDRHRARRPRPGGPSRRGAWCRTPTCWPTSPWPSTGRWSRSSRRPGHPRGHPLVRRRPDRPGDRRGAERRRSRSSWSPCSSRTAGGTSSQRTRAARCWSAASARRTPSGWRRSTTRRSRPDAPAALCEAGPVSLHGLLLAAGAGTRMGTPKALVRDDDGTSWLLRSVAVLRDGGCVGVTVVLGAEAARATALLDGQRRPGRRRRPLGGGHG